MEQIPLNRHTSLWRQALGTLHPSHEEIAALAYARYVSRQGTDGSAMKDWLEAERELTGRTRPPSDD